MVYVSSGLAVAAIIIETIAAATNARPFEKGTT
jgi:hypothetical protein